MRQRNYSTLRICCAVPRLIKEKSTFWIFTPPSRGLEGVKSLFLQIKNHSIHYLDNTGIIGSDGRYRGFLFEVQNLWSNKRW